MMKALPKTSFVILLVVLVGFLFFAGLRTVSFSNGLSGLSFSGVERAHATDAIPQATSNNDFDKILNSPTSIIGRTIFEILDIIMTVIGFLIAVAAYFVGLAMQINLDLLQPSSNVAVSVGWDIFRQITNLGFVLGIIVIAIATIVRSQSYRAQQILWKLIVAALLVNFSLVIAGAFLKVSDSLSGYFISYFHSNTAVSATYNPPNDSVENLKSGKVTESQPNNLLINDITKQITNFAGSPAVISPPKDDTNKHFWEYMSNASVLSSVPGIGPVITLGYLLSTFTNGLPLFIIVSENINIIALLIIFLTFVVLAGQIFIRYFFITALLIVSPIVWLMWVFPFGTRWWKEWWQHFIKWTFMLPINLFFLWFAVKMMSGVKTAVMIMADNLFNASGRAVPIGISSFSAITGSYVAIAFIILGMKMAHKIGITTSDASIKWASSAGNFVKDKAVQYGGRGLGAGAAAVGRRAGVENIGVKMSAWAGKGTGITGWLARETVGRAGKGLIGAGAAAQRREGEPIFGKAPEEFAAEYRDKTKWTKNRLLQAYAGVPREQQLAIIRELVDRRQLNDETITSMGNNDLTRGQDELVRQAEFLKKGGRKDLADRVYTESLAKSGEQIVAEKEYNVIPEVAVLTNARRAYYAHPESERRDYEKIEAEVGMKRDEIKKAEEDHDRTKKEYEEIVSKAGGVITPESVKARDALNQIEAEVTKKQNELKPLEVKLNSLSNVVKLKARIDTAEADVANVAKSPVFVAAVQKINDATDKFNKDYHKPDEQKAIGKTVFRRDEKDITEAERISRVKQAEHINADPSGRKFFGILPAADTSDKMLAMMKSLVLAATKQTRLTGDLEQAFKKSFASGKTDGLVEQMRKNGVTDEALLHRLIKQIRRGAAGDIGVSEFGSEESATKPKGGGKKVKKPEDKGEEDE